MLAPVVARMVSVMNASVMLFVITRVIRDCLRTQNWLNTK